MSKFKIKSVHGLLSVKGQAVQEDCLILQERNR